MVMTSLPVLPAGVQQRCLRPTFLRRLDRVPANTRRSGGLDLRERAPIFVRFLQNEARWIQLCSHCVAAEPTKMLRPAELKAWHSNC